MKKTLLAFLTLFSLSAMADDLYSCQGKNLTSGVRTRDRDVSFLFAVGSDPRLEINNTLVHLKRDVRRPELLAYTGYFNQGEALFLEAKIVTPNRNKTPFLTEVRGINIKDKEKFFFAAECRFVRVL